MLVLPLVTPHVRVEFGCVVTTLEHADVLPIDHRQIALLLRRRFSRCQNIQCIEIDDFFADFDFNYCVRSRKNFDRRSRVNVSDAVRLSLCLITLRLPQFGMPISPMPSHVRLMDKLFAAGSRTGHASFTGGGQISKCRITFWRLRLANSGRQDLLLNRFFGLNSFFSH